VPFICVGWMLQWKGYVPGAEGAVNDPVFPGWMSPVSNWPAVSEVTVCVDGPLRASGHPPRTIGYVKTHDVRYLQPEGDAVVAALEPGERTPVFLAMGRMWTRYSWYLRLPSPIPAAHPWSGIVRVECAAELPVARAVALADLSVVTLPRFASAPYKDPRAPQNLVPIAGLERRLRTLLGDGRLLHRTLTRASVP